MLVIAALLALVAGEAPAPDAGWKTLAPGIELRLLEARQRSSAGDSRIAVVRVDPKSWELAIVGQSGAGVAKGRSAREWARTNDLVLAINAGMFGEDYSTHVGYMETRGHVNSSRINSYQSVTAFDPRDPANRPAFRIFDLDEPGVTVQSIRQDYGSLVQNLRLIKRPGTNRWSQQNEKWSEAALGEDADGRILFVLTRSPYSMHDLVGELLSAGIGVVAAQHLEGGRLAQLYLNVGDFELELFESYDGGFGVDAAKPTAWPIPNVLGIRRRSDAK